MNKANMALKERGGKQKREKERRRIEIETDWQSAKERESERDGERKPIDQLADQTFQGIANRLPEDYTLD